jgi:hypothetical protein
VRFTFDYARRRTQTDNSSTWAGENNEDPVFIACILFSLGADLVVCDVK